jgi:hypothetical protein
VTRDFGPIWDVTGTVDAFARLEDVPLGYWPVIIMDDIQEPGAAGVHKDKDHQPFSLVQFSDSWQLTTSHETLEMLADPFGNRLIAGDSPKTDQGRVEFLVEVCDPSEGAEFGYSVNGIVLSDFYTPNYFDPVQSAGVRYSYTGAITEPRQVLRGGYLSWHEPVSDHWWQEVFFDGSSEFRDLGTIDDSTGSLRTAIDRRTTVEAFKSMVKNKRELVSAARSYGSLVSRPSASKADAWRARIAEVTGSASRSAETSEAPSAGRRKPPRRGRTAEG